MKKIQRSMFFYLIIFLVAVFFIWDMVSPATKTEELNFSEVLSKIENNQVTQINVEDNVISGKLKGDKDFNVYVPNMFLYDYGVKVMDYAKKNNIPITTEAPSGESIWISILPTLLLIGALIFIWFFFINSAQGGANKAMNFGKNKAKLHKQDNSKKITFADVAGLKEEKEEMEEIVDFLKKPKKYIDLGARIPKGILMVGLPGTGKTYLSRAVAGEAGVPFYSISGSDFVEMFVGVGASRVRNLFNDAKKDSPCIVFIDEIDAVGRRRGAGLGGGNDEREQTLNQLLVEMDGFKDNQGIIIIAATNRPDILDPALLRPGRFDRQIHVGIPDVREREAILKVHSRTKKLSDDVKFDVLAKRTPGFTPADLENVLNEAALMSARDNRDIIDMATIESAATKVMVGVEKKSKIVSPKEKRLVSVHEAGHAIVRYYLPDVDPVHQVTIVPRGGAGGFTMHLPSEERNYMRKSQMLNDIKILLGGRAAEQVVFKDVSTGASNDLERVAKLAKAMVTKYAMGDGLSQMTYGENDNVFLGRDLTTKSDHSENVASQVDKEIRSIVDGCYTETLEILSSHMDKLEKVAQALNERETIDAEEFKNLMEDSELEDVE